MDRIPRALKLTDNWPAGLRPTRRRELVHVVGIAAILGSLLGLAFRLSPLSRTPAFRPPRASLEVVSRASHPTAPVSSRPSPRPSILRTAQPEAEAEAFWARTGRFITPGTKPQKWKLFTVATRRLAHPGSPWPSERWTPRATQKLRNGIGEPVPERPPRQLA